MLELIILAIIAYFLIRKLGSLLGEESDEIYFGYNDINSIKEAEKVCNKDDNEKIDDEYDYLSDEAKENLKVINNKINNFSLSKFKNIASKVLECVIKANNEKNKDEIKKFLSQELAESVCSSFSEDSDTNYHIYLVSFKEIKVLDINRNNNVFKIKILFSTEQINYTTDKNNNIIDGDKHNILSVNENWTFSHDFSKKNSIWFVEDIEEI